MTNDLLKDIIIQNSTVNVGGDMIGRDKVTAREATPPDSGDAAFRVLVIISRPLDVSELPVIADQWQLIRGLAQVDAPAYIKILTPPTIESLRSELHNRYDVIHFDGHGSFDRANNNGALYFEKTDGTYEKLLAAELVKMIQEAGATTKLVALSACESAMGDDESLAGTLVSGGIRTVIGMKEVITVTTTLAFFRPLYAALGAGRSIAEAVEAARPALDHIPNPISTTPTRDLPLLFGDGALTLCDEGRRGELQIENDLLVGVPDAANFFGEFGRGAKPSGRKGLLTQIARAFEEGERLIALVGEGGIGKTALATVAAQRNAWRFGGVFWRSAADSAGFQLDNLLDVFAKIFGQGFYALPLAAKRDAVLDYLRDLRTPALIVVDNFETIKDEAVLKFLREMPAPSAAMITTREALEYGGFTVDVNAMEDEEGVKFFVREAQRVKADDDWGKSLSSEERRNIFEICRLLEGHPLALMIAAALLRSNTIAGALAQVKANPARGEVGKRFDFSYNPLPDVEKDLLHRLTSFASIINPLFLNHLCTNPQLCGDSPIPNWNEAITELVRKSFVDVIETTAKDENGNEITFNRYRLHPIMRQYAHSKPERKIIYRHDLNTAKLLTGFAQQYKQNFDALENELGNLLGVMEWGLGIRMQGLGVEGLKIEDLRAEVARIEIAMAWAIAMPNSGVLGVRGYWSEARKRLAQATEAAKQIGDVHSEGAFINSRATISVSQGYIIEAKNDYSKALEIARTQGFKQGEAATLHQLAILAQDTGDLTEARKLYDQSLQMRRELGDKQGIASSLHQLAMLAEHAGDLTEARNLYDQSLQLKRELGDKQGIAQTLHNLAIIAQNTGDLTEARNLYNQSLQMKRELGNKQGIASTLHQLASLAQAAGDLTEARKLYNESGFVFNELGDKQSLASSFAQMALLEEQEKNYSVALELIRQAEKLFIELGSPMREQARRDRERLEGLVSTDEGNG